MELPVVVGVDGSDGSLLAVDWAAAEVARSGLPLRLVYASLWERYEGVQPEFSPERPSEQVFADNVVGMAEERVHRLAPDVKVAADVMPEDPVTALLRQAHEAAFVVLGSRGRGPISAMLLGSVSLAVAARAHGPVIVVRGEEPNRHARNRRIVLGVGDTAESSAAARFAFCEAQSQGSKVVAVRAWRCPPYENMPYPLFDSDHARAYRQEANERVDQVLGDVPSTYPDVDVERKVVQNTAHLTLLEEAAGADLLVVGAQRRRGVVGLQLGRVTHAVLHHAACPVAVVPERT